MYLSSFIKMGFLVMHIAKIYIYLCAGRVTRSALNLIWDHLFNVPSVKDFLWMVLFRLHLKKAIIF